MHLSFSGQACIFGFICGLDVFSSIAILMDMDTFTPHTPDIILKYFLTFAPWNAEWMHCWTRLLSSSTWTTFKKMNRVLPIAEAAKYNSKWPFESINLSIAYMIFKWTRPYCLARSFPAKQGQQNVKLFFRLKGIKYGWLGLQRDRRFGCNFKYFMMCLAMRLDG